MANIFKLCLLDDTYHHVGRKKFFKYVKCVFPCLGFLGRLPSSVEYNQLPSVVASQSNETGNNNNKSDTQSE